MDCLFCKIANHEIPSKIIYEDSDVIAFNDINPRAPTHILIVPKKHLESIATLRGEDAVLVGKLITIASKLAKSKGIFQKGFRLIFNTGKHSGQEIDHVHLHLLGGKPLGPMVQETVSEKWKIKNGKSQIPRYKLQINSKFQIPKLNNPTFIGNYKLKIVSYI